MTKARSRGRFDTIFSDGVSRIVGACRDADRFESHREKEKLLIKRGRAKRWVLTSRVCMNIYT